MSYKKYILTTLVIVSFCIEDVSVKLYPKIKGALISQGEKWDIIEASKWDDEFQLVEITSSDDGSLQSAYFFSGINSGVDASKKPLLVSLHTWSGNYSQVDPLSAMALKQGWNYIHPDFRGPNWSKDSCLSKLVTTDIDDAIQYAIDNSNVDIENIFVVGVSGGGYAALGSYLKTRHKIKAFLSWVPISDLSAWYYQSMSLNNEKYSKDILACTSGSQVFNEQSAIKRSPLYWDIPAENNGVLEIYAGINDGHIGYGSVPISHSILFFNHLVSNYGLPGNRVSEDDTVKLLTRAHEINATYNKIGDRQVIYQNM